MKYVLVSACLLGVNCRYNGVEKADENVLRLMEEQEKICLIPVCPEQLGGLATPREPSECQNDRVVSRAGVDVTGQYCRGAEETLKLAKLYHCDTAILKERSPSCGHGQIYDGTFTQTLMNGDGVTVRLLKSHGIRVIGESGLNSYKYGSWC